MQRLSLSNTIFLVIYTFLFSSLIFVGKEIFFPSHTIQEQYLEPVAQGANFHHEHSNVDDFWSFSWVVRSDVEQRVQKIIYKTFSERYKREQESKVDIRYIPTQFKDDIEISYTPLVEVFLYERDVLSHIDSLRVLLHENPWDTRGRMKSWNIHMYGVTSMSDDEFMQVLIHEFAHYHDIYGLPWNAFGDRSQDFYDISWKSVTRLKPDAEQEDFVSWYATTNQYEDFAESYLYYMLHNDQFAQRASQNPIVQLKYDYFKNVIFTRNQFYESSFASSDEIRTYYWDITKIPIDIKKFLQYLQDTI